MSRKQPKKEPFIPPIIDMMIEAKQIRESEEKQKIKEKENNDGD